MFAVDRLRCACNEMTTNPILLLQFVLECRYCRFFLGRRCNDDARQVSRWTKCAGEAGRWKRNLIAKCVRAGKSYDDFSVSPVVRQTLMHWAYELTEKDYDEYAAQVRQGKATSFIPQYSMQHVVENNDSDEESRGKSGTVRASNADGRAERAKKRARN
jgi:hypothetical protein